MLLIKSMDSHTHKLGESLMSRTSCLCLMSWLTDISPYRVIAILIYNDNSDCYY